MEGHYTTNYKIKLEQNDKWPPAQALGNDIVNKPNNRTGDVHYNNNSVIFNRVHNLPIVETNWQTLTGTSTDVFWTKTFKEATGRTAGMPLEWNQRNLQTVDNTVAVCDIMPHIEHTGSAPDKTPPLFYPFNSEAEYAQVL